MKLSFNSGKSPELVLQYLSDMDKFTSVHPLITRMESNGQSAFIAHETLKLLFLPISFTYPVTMERNEAEGKVEFKATVMRLAKISLLFKITAAGTGSLIEEDIQFSSILPVKFIMKKVLKKQHGLLFENIEKA